MNSHMNHTLYLSHAVKLSQFLYIIVPNFKPIYSTFKKPYPKGKIINE